MHNSGFIAANQTAMLGDAFHLSCTFLIFLLLRHQDLNLDIPKIKFTWEMAKC